MLRENYRSFNDYTVDLKRILEEFSDIIVYESVEVFEAVKTEGYIKGSVILLDGSSLNFLEYVRIRNRRAIKMKYRYNYVDKDSNVVFRYDNAPHHREIKTYPHHKHLADGTVEPTVEPDLKSILEEIATYVK